MKHRITLSPAGRPLAMRHTCACGAVGYCDIPACRVPAAVLTCPACTPGDHDPHLLAGYCLGASCTACLAAPHGAP